MHRHGFNLMAAIACAAWMGLSTCAGADFPDRPMRLIIPFPAGGPTDIIGRLVAEKASSQFGQPVVVDNRAGAGGLIGSNDLAKSAPDGYTMGYGIGVGVTSTFVKEPPFDLYRDLAPVSRVLKGGLVIYVSTAVPANNLKEFIAYAKANPGKLNHGSPATLDTLALMEFSRRAGLDITDVPYKGTAPVVTALLANEVQIVIDGVLAYKPSLDAGKIKALALALDQRLALLPNLPTAEEAGLPGYSTPFNLGVWVPARTPQPIIGKLNSAVVRAVSSPDMQERIKAGGQVPVGGSPEDYLKASHEEYDFWSRIAKSVNYQPQ